MKNVVTLYKPVGYTPLELIRKLEITYPEYAGLPLGYAGRLDPMADGVLLILIGDENKKRKEYELLSKKYQFTVLFGIETDTYDCMGLITHIHLDIADIKKEQLKEFCTTCIGSWDQEYPPYSSPRVKGKPLFYWARNNALSDIVIPKKRVSVEGCTLINVNTISSDVLLETIKTRIARVTGDFRQATIVHKWEEELGNKHSNLYVATFDIQCSSGLYVRSLAHTLGSQLGTGAIAMSITRTAVGTYTSDQALHIMDTS